MDDGEDGREFILCAAMHYPDGKVYQEQPTNITSGIVSAGRRHNNAYKTLEQIMPNFDENLITHACMGFITSTNRFVSRKEGYQIAKREKQIQFGLETSDNGEDSILISENLY